MATPRINVTIPLLIQPPPNVTNTVLGNTKAETNTVKFVKNAKTPAAGDPVDGAIASPINLNAETNTSPFTNVP